MALYVTRMQVGISPVTAGMVFHPDDKTVVLSVFWDVSDTHSRYMMLRSCLYIRCFTLLILFLPFLSFTPSRLFNPLSSSRLLWNIVPSRILHNFQMWFPCLFLTNRSASRRLEAAFPAIGSLLSKYKQSFRNDRHTTYPWKKREGCIFHRISLSMNGLNSSEGLKDFRIKLSVGLFSYKTGRKSARFPFIKNRSWKIITHLDMNEIRWKMR